MDDKLDKILDLLTQNQKLITNGQAQMHDDYYGNADRSIKGTKPMVEEHDDAINTSKTIVRTLLGVVGLVGIGNIVALIALLGG